MTQLIWTWLLLGNLVAMLPPRNPGGYEGMRGDGVTDDYTALVHYIHRCQTAGKAVRLEPRTYFISQPLSLTGSVQFASTQPGKTATLLFPAGRPDEEAVRAENPATAHQSRLARSARIGARTITLTNTGGLVAGMLLTLTSSRIWELGGNNAGEVHLIRAVQGTSVTLKDTLQDSYDVPAETVTVSAYRPVAFRLTDVAIRRQGGGNRNINLSVWHYVNAEIQRFRIGNGQKAGILLYACYNTKIHHGAVSGSNLGGEGYGIVVYGGMYTNIYQVHSRNNRKLADFSAWGSGSGPARYGWVHQNRVVGSGLDERGQNLFAQGQNMGIGSHGGSEHILIEDNTIVDCYVGIQLRGRHMRVAGNRVQGRCWTPFWSYGGYNHSWENNVYTAGPASRTVAGQAASAPTGYPYQMFYIDPLMAKKGYVQIRGNRSDFSLRYGVVGEGVGNDLTVIDNSFGFYTQSRTDTITGIALLQQRRPIRTVIHRNAYRIRGPGSLATPLQIRPARSN
ncbi:hypothetical protein GCM10023187_05320 [Nibrella viscosa]|uniref:Right handed beta helix region n=1 Tax=Nibrella viscosa TaxID=1084524 RepID=A0ABP8JVT6_9BACT